ncbi:Wzz/FepE/Etk N-terminal domain-containing protein [Mucilaginibacter agri]|uniref:Lipopolysaccharide biosynthesis protein n=1 Tax=Mucilaginibacter agri TaxID=2695265 RepID=A0A965ZGR2_9SPHI|nr:Wzz/FepE/Etk N-terminal domain-containing protein [Mucilaginibacter agri]NCD70758.1 lipopolysaccharide biosynthesis protein [Mucilaginibacter agri]
MTNTTSVNDTDQVKEVSLKELILKFRSFLRYLKSKKILIISIAFICGCLGFVYAFIKEPTYKANLIFALEDDKSGGGLGGAFGLASQFGFDLGSSGGGAFSGDNLLQLLKSRSMIEKTLLSEVTIKNKNESLADYYISFNKLRDAWKDKPKLKNISFLPNYDRTKFSLQQDSVLGELYSALAAKNLTVDKADKKLSIITVSVTTENELFSKLFAEKLVETVSDFYIATKTKKSVQNVNILQNQTDSVKRRLNSTITGIASLNDANPNINPSRLVLKATSQQKQVDVQASTAVLTQLVANLELAKVSLRKETPLIQIIDSPILPLEKHRLGRIKSGILGGFVGAFAVIFALMIGRVYKKVMA